MKSHVARDTLVILMLFIVAAALNPSLTIALAFIGVCMIAIDIILGVFLGFK